jgi:hypothetical protein
MPEPVTSDVVVTKPFMTPVSEWGLWSLVYMQVCAYGETPPERIEEVANAENPPGTSSAWHLTTEGPDGQDFAPVPCAENPARLHHMLSC